MLMLHASTYTSQIGLSTSFYLNKIKTMNIYAKILNVFPSLYVTNAKIGNAIYMPTHVFTYL